MELSQFFFPFQIINYFNSKKGLLPAGTDIAMLFDVFDMIVNCEDETLFGGEATLDTVPPLECQVATEAKITTT